MPIFLKNIKKLLKIKKMYGIIMKISENNKKLG